MFNVFNDSGILIMDANDSQLALAGILTIFLSSTTTTYSSEIMSNCLIGLGNTNGAYVRVTHDKSNGVLTVSSDISGVNIVVYLFADLKNIATSGSAGLNVFDSSGKILFDATRKVARLASVGASQFSSAQAIPVNSIPILIFADMFKVMRTVPQGDYFIYYFGIPFYQNNGAELKSKYISVMSQPLPASSIGSQPDYSMMNVPILFFKI